MYVFSKTSVIEVLFLSYKLRRVLHTNSIDWYCIWACANDIFVVCDTFIDSLNDLRGGGKT